MPNNKYFSSVWKITGQTSILVIILSFPLYLFINQPWRSSFTQNEPFFAGKESCIECHETEYNLWKGSHHDMSMTIASDSTVLGNFNNYKFRHNKVIHTFFRKDNKFYVNTTDAEGKHKDFEITHTFGWTPLQQYLIPFENGKYQCLPIAWDTDKNRWFHLGDTLYPHENLNGNNWLYWTNQAQNWNGMCADCHSTNLKKNYNHITKTYNTTFSEINVSCEACHGPASEHIKWAALPANSRPNNNAGLIIATSNISNTHFVNNCARCHSRRSAMCDFNNNTTELLNHIIPEKPTKPYYYVDGQILEEDYVYSSFTQSKMYTKDIQCNDCHNSHSLKLKSHKNDLCLQCHQPSIYDTPNHHFHKMPGNNYSQLASNTGKPTYTEGEGARCVNCHMDGNHYMGNDYRRDHSFRIPRPDLTISIGTPNACNNCHIDKNPDWANKYIKQWYGQKIRPHYGSVFNAAYSRDTFALNNTTHYALNEVYPLMVRTAAIYYLQNFNNSLSNNTLETLLTDPESIIRYSALESFNPSNSKELLNRIMPLLNDPTKAIRAHAAYKLSEIPRNQLSKEQLSQIDSALNEYEEINIYMADFPGAQYNLGNMYMNKGDINKAQQCYETSLAIDNKFYMSKANLAVIYNIQGNNTLAEQMYKELISEQSEIQDFKYSLALLLAETGKLEESKYYLSKYLDSTPKNARAWYNLGIIETNLNMIANAEISYLKALSIEPENFDFLWAISIHYIKSNKINKAEKYINALEKLYPENNNIRQLKKQL